MVKIMKINEIKETKEVVVRTEYVAIDGTVFRTKEECEQWEKSYKCTITQSMKAIPHVETDGESAYLQCGNDCDEVWIVKPRDFEDIKVINAYTEATCYGCKTNFTQDDIGKMIAINFGCDHDWCEVYRLEGYVESIRNTYEKFENKIDGKENDNA